MRWFLAFLFGTMTMQAQVEPEFKGDVAWQAEPNDLVSLEKQRATLQNNISASTYIVGIGKVKVRNLVNGNASPVRIPQQEQIDFVVNAGSNERNPIEVINVFKLNTSKKNKRFVDLAEAGTFSGGSAGENIQFVSFSGKRHGEKSYLVSIRYLTPGEYAITIDGSREIFNMFGVDKR